MASPQRSCDDEPPSNFFHVKTAIPCDDLVLPMTHHDAHSVRDATDKEKFDGTVFERETKQIRVVGVGKDGNIVRLQLEPTVVRTEPEKDKEDKRENEGGDENSEDTKELTKKQSAEKLQGLTYAMTTHPLRVIVEHSGCAIDAKEEEEEGAAEENKQRSSKTRCVVYLALHNRTQVWKNSIKLVAFVDTTPPIINKDTTNSAAGLILHIGVLVDHLRDDEEYTSDDGPAQTLADKNQNGARLRELAAVALPLSINTISAIEWSQRHVSVTTSGTPEKHTDEEGTYLYVYKTENDKPEDLKLTLSESQPHFFKGMFSTTFSFSASAVLEAMIGIAFDAERGCRAIVIHTVDETFFFPLCDYPSFFDVKGQQDNNNRNCCCRLERALSINSTAVYNWVEIDDGDESNNAGATGGEENGATTAPSYRQITFGAVATSGEFIVLGLRKKKLVKLSDGTACFRINDNNKGVSRSTTSPCSAALADLDFSLRYRVAQSEWIYAVCCCLSSTVLFCTEFRGRFRVHAHMEFSELSSIHNVVTLAPTNNREDQQLVVFGTATRKEQQERDERVEEQEEECRLCVCVVDYGKTRLLDAVQQRADEAIKMITAPLEKQQEEEKQEEQKEGKGKGPEREGVRQRLSALRDFVPRSSQLQDQAIHNRVLMKEVMLLARTHTNATLLISAMVEAGTFTTALRAEYALIDLLLFFFNKDTFLTLIPRSLLLAALELLQTCAFIDGKNPKDFCQQVLDAEILSVVARLVLNNTTEKLQPLSPDDALVSSSPTPPWTIDSKVICECSRVLQFFCRGKPFPPLQSIQCVLPAASRLLHSRDTLTLENALWVLSHYTENNSSQAPIQDVIDCGCIADIFALLKGVPLPKPQAFDPENPPEREHEYQQPMRHGVTQGLISDIMSFLSHQQLQPLLFGCKDWWYDIICQDYELYNKALRPNTQNNALITPALRVCGNIVTGTDAQTEVVVDLGLIDFLFPLFSNTHVMGLKKECAWIMSNIAAGTQKQADMLLTVPNTRTLTQSYFPSHLSVQRELLWCLANGINGAGPAARSSVIKHGTVVIAVHAILRGTVENDKKMQAVGTECLAVLLSHITAIHPTEDDCRARYRRAAPLYMTSSNIVLPSQDDLCRFTDFVNRSGYGDGDESAEKEKRKEEEGEEQVPPSGEEQAAVGTIVFEFLLDVGIPMIRAALRRLVLTNTREGRETTEILAFPGLADVFEEEDSRDTEEANATKEDADNVGEK